MKVLSRPRLILLVLVGLLALHTLGILKPIERAVAGALAPVQRWLVGRLPQGRNETGQDQAKRIHELEAQVSRLLSENVLLREERRSSALTDEQVNFLERRSLAGVTANVIGRSPEGDTELLILDRGEDQRITAGQPVVTGEGILVGTILETSPGRSIVRLVTDPQSTIAVEVENQERSPGFVVGQHGLTLRMRLIPQLEKVEKHQAVVTSAINEKIPANLALGTITDIHFATGDLFQEASVEPLVNLDRLSVVTIIQGRR